MYFVLLLQVREQMKSNFAEVAMCGGFFIIYFIDEFIHFFFGEAIQHTHATAPVAPSPSSGNGYGATSNNERAPLLASDSAHHHQHHHHHSEHHQEK